MDQLEVVPLLQQPAQQGQPAGFLAQWRATRAFGRFAGFALKFKRIDELRLHMVGKTTYVCLRVGHFSIKFQSWASHQAISWEMVRG